MTPRPGPATLVGFAQIDQPALHRLIIAPGSFVGEGFPRTGTSNAGFRFEGADPAGSWRAWCLAGANHHGAVAGGDHTEVLRRAGALLGLEVVVIREGGAA